MVAKDDVANIKSLFKNRYMTNERPPCKEGPKNHPVCRYISIGLCYLPNIHNKNFEWLEILGIIFAKFNAD